MKRIAPVFVLLLLALATFGQTKNTITKSTITFQIKNLGIATGGSLAGLQANIDFNPANLNAGIIDATVDVNTINTGNDQRDTHLKSADFFDAAHFPKIELKSISVKHKSGANYVGQFNVTMHGKTKEINMPFSYTENGNILAFKGTLKLNRLDFGVGSESLVLSNDVVVNIEVELSKG